MCIIHTVSGQLMIFYHASWVPFKLKGVDYEQNLISSTSMRRLSKAAKTISIHDWYYKVHTTARNGALELFCDLSSSYLYLKTSVLMLPVLVMSRRGQTVSVSP